VLAVNPDIKAGIKFHYSDTGFNILGNIISKVSGLSYPTYIQRYILQPSEMNASGFYSGVNGLSPGVEPYKNGQIIPQDQRWPFDPQFFPAEGLITTVSDLSLWVNEVLAKNPKLLTKISHQQMLAPQHNPTWENTRIGLGWFMVKRNGIEYTYHMGSVRGYESIIAMDINASSAIILLTNSSDVPRWEIVDLIEKLIKKDSLPP
jgi:CubicO group peptidase (beta-lactamase class C family)